jgi:MFS superfamily sulfate permease-like transporter
VAEQSGAKSQLTGLVGAGVVVLLLVFFNGLLADLPNSALAAVVIAAALSLADFAVLGRVWKVRRSAVVLSLVASAGVIFLGVLEGILVAVVLSILLFFQRNWWPHGEVLGKVPGRDGWHSDSDGNGLVEEPDVVVFRWEAPLFFANSGMFADQIRELVKERHPTWIVLQCEAITDIDVTAAGMLERLDNELNAKGIHLAFVEMRSRLRDLVHDYGLHEALDREHFYGTIEEALADIESATGTETSPS